MPPVEIVELDLHEIPVHLSAVVHLQGVVKDGDVAVIAEAQIADGAFLFLLDEVLQDAVVDIAAVELLHGIAAASDAVQQQVVDIGDLQLAQRVLEHLDACGA